MKWVQSGQTFEAVLAEAPPALGSTLTVEIVDPPDTVVVPATNAGIVESSDVPGVYTKADMVAPSPSSDSIMLLAWKAGAESWVEELLVTTSVPHVSDAIKVRAGQPFKVFLAEASVGMTDLGVRVIDPPDTELIPRTTAVEESAEVPGLYTATLVAPTPTDTTFVLVVWDAPSAAGVPWADAILITIGPGIDIDVPGDIVPDVAEVGNLLRARTKDDSGNELGTFTDATRPTAAGAQALITAAVGDLTGEVGVTFPGDTAAKARSLVVLRAAMLIELSYFPEQVRSDKSPYAAYERLYNAGLKALIASIEEGAEPGMAQDEGYPSWAFPEDVGGMVGWQTNW